MKLRSNSLLLVLSSEKIARLNKHTTLWLVYISCNLFRKYSRTIERALQLDQYDTINVMGRARWRGSLLHFLSFYSNNKTGSASHLRRHVRGIPSTRVGHFVSLHHVRYPSRIVRWGKINWAMSNGNFLIKTRRDRREKETWFWLRRVWRVSSNVVLSHSCERHP